VLDRLLEREDIAVEGISGSSSGAMNAVMLAYGHTENGREGARELLARFWERVAGLVSFDSPIEGLLNYSASEPPPWLHAYLEFSRQFSPYLVNPSGYNPLRAIIAELVDFERLRSRCPIKLYIASTQVRTGKLEIFRNRDLSVDALLASACVPSIHHAVEIDGESYWDGGFSGNPPIAPLLFRCRRQDIVMVMLHPASRPSTPTTPTAIWEHMMELAFNSTFLREMNILSELKAQAEKRFFPLGRLERRLRRVRFHRIEQDLLDPQLSYASRFNTRWSFLCLLRERGRERADQWLEETYGKRRRSTIAARAARLA
jgi:NTE family protein